MNSKRFLNSVSNCSLSFCSFFLRFLFLFRFSKVLLYHYTYYIISINVKYICIYIITYLLIFINIYNNKILTYILHKKFASTLIDSSHTNDFFSRQLSSIHIYSMVSERCCLLVLTSSTTMHQQCIKWQLIFNM